eukprot:m.82393 g.82393  ORF g.82393 m.82393 type:complete len:931 (+) comp14727_c0_seq3:118-2910(+)
MVPDATTLSAVVHRAWVARKSPVVFGMEVSAVPSCATDLCGVLLDAAAVSPVPSKRFYEYLSHVVVCKIVPASTLWSAFKTHQAVTAQKPQHLQALLAVALPLCDACDLGQEEPMAFATARCHAFTALVQLAADCAKLVVDKTLSSTSSVHASNLGVCLQLVLGFLSSRASLNLLHVTDESDAVVDAVAKSVEQLQHSQDLLLAPSGSQSLPTAVTEYLQPTLARVKGWTEAWRVRAHIQAVALDCWPRDAGPDPSPRLLAQFEASRFATGSRRYRGTVWDTLSQSCRAHSTASQHRVTALIALWERAAMHWSMATELSEATCRIFLLARIPLLASFMDDGGLTVTEVQEAAATFKTTYDSLATGLTPRLRGAPDFSQLCLASFRFHGLFSDLDVEPVSAWFEHVISHNELKALVQALQPQQQGFSWATAGATLEAAFSRPDALLLLANLRAHGLLSALAGGLQVMLEHLLELTTNPAPGSDAPPSAPVEKTLLVQRCLTLSRGCCEHGGERRFWRCDFDKPSAEPNNELLDEVLAQLLPTAEQPPQDTATTTDQPDYTKTHTEFLSALSKLTQASDVLALGQPLAQQICLALDASVMDTAKAANVCMALARKCPALFLQLLRRLLDQCTVASATTGVTQQAKPLVLALRAVSPAGLDPVTRDVCGRMIVGLDAYAEGRVPPNIKHQAQVELKGSTADVAVDTLQATCHSAEPSWLLNMLASQITRRPKMQRQRMCRHSCLAWMTAASTPEMILRCAVPLCVDVLPVSVVRAATTEQAVCLAWLAFQFATIAAATFFPPQTVPSQSSKRRRRADGDGQELHEVEASASERDAVGKPLTHLLCLVANLLEDSTGAKLVFAITFMDLVTNCGLFFKGPTASLKLRMRLAHGLRRHKVASRNACLLFTLDDPDQRQACAEMCCLPDAALVLSA